MADMIYRGVRYDPAQMETPRPKHSAQLIYRGVAYSREDIDDAPRTAVEICFRGIRYRKHSGRNDLERLPAPA